jgi:hypothetical protein
MKLNRISAIALVILLGVMSITQAQKPEPNIRQVEDEIAKLSAIDRNTETPTEIRAINRSFLEERKKRLRSMLEQRIATLREYRRLVSFSDSESRLLEETIKTSERELRDLDDAFLHSTPMSTRAISGQTPTPTPASKQRPKKTDTNSVTIKVDQNVTATVTDNLKNPSNANDKATQKAFDAEMSKFIEDQIGTALGLKNKDHCIVHLVKWVDGKITNRNNVWLLYKRDDKKKGDNIWVRQTDDDGKRIYGFKEVAVLLIHLDAPGPAPDITYKVSVNRRIPAPLSDLMTLLGALGAGAKAAPFNMYGAKLIEVENLPSDIVVSSSIPVGDQTQEFNRTVIVEGLYFWDVSLGVPVKTIKELQFVSDGNKVTTASKERQDVYGFLNIYPWKVDVLGDKVLAPPHFLFGVPLASKPLHHPFVGIGAGVYKSPIKFNLFAGVIFNRELVPRTLTTGSTATPSQLDADLHARWVRKFTWGISFPVSQIKDAIKK